MDAGGYRQIRVLSEDPDEQVLLCRRADDESAEPVVLRVVGEGRADAAIAVSGAVESPHLAPILDLCELPGDRFGLVYPRLARGSLAELLARRPRLAAGEAVTILVSVARAVAELHRCGFVHGSLRGTGVLFDDAGTPVVTGFGSATALTPTTARGDARALAALAGRVLAAVPGAEGFVRTLTDPPDGVAPKDMEEQLFAFADPRPVEFPPPAAPTIEQLLPSRTAPPETPPPAPPAGLSRWSAGNPVALALRKVLGELRTVRRRVWIPAVLAVGGLAGLLLVVPQGEGDPAAGVPAAPASSGPVAPTPAAAAFDPPDPAALSGDDPVAAARALAAGRDSCLRAGSVDCLDAVDQPGSALFETDRVAGDSLPPTLTAPGAAPTVQRSGDAALVAFGSEAVLLIRLEGEWRLRDVFTAEGP